jgi:hypothetical protein
MKTILLAVLLISIPFSGCKKSKEDKKEPVKTVKTKVKPVKTVKVVKKVKKTVCENAVSTLNNCLVKPKKSKDVEKKLVVECDKLLKGQNKPYIKDVKCLASLAGDCKNIDKCLPKKDKKMCEVFADTRIKCRRKELSDSLKMDLREFLVQECELNVKGGSKDLIAIYNCFKSSREVCYNSTACFKKLITFEKKIDATAKQDQEKKFKKLDKKGKKLYANCLEFTATCMKGFKSTVKKGFDPLVIEQCKHDMFSANKETVKKMECLKTYTKKTGCDPIDKCIKKVK